MPREILEAWLFDAYPEPEGMRVWVIDREGRHRHFLDPWLAALYVSGDESRLSRALAFLRRAPFPTRAAAVERTDLFSGKAVPVLEVRVPPLLRGRAAGELKRMGLTLHSADIHLVQQYHYDRGHFPLARCRFSVEDARLAGWELQDDPWAVDYELPPLRTVHLALSRSDVAGQLDPNHAPRGKLVLSMEGCAHELEGPMAEQLDSLARRLREWDPDLLATDWGDSFLLPRLDAEARRLGLSLPWSRDPGRGMAGRGERSFYTYGRTVYQGGARCLFGRWHLDMRNSFMLRETGTHGLFEIARIARIPVQRAGRCTIGTSLSSMQMDWAWRHGVLIPMDKAQAEDFRPASDLLAADKGGLCYEPDVGWHENVAEYDFASMYPEMMVRHNISPETVNCACCKDNAAPGLGHNLCRRRRGLVPSVLAPILAKRARYKALAKEGGARASVYKARAAAHKWCLVCCFGYLGFKNARFGKIEAHECVTAWGREVLLRAKDVVERRGLRLLHALVDSVWVKVVPGTDLEELRAAMEREAGCPLSLDGVYRWIRFCPSKQSALSGVPGRYFGAFGDGELKLRGIACRRRDTPGILKSLQRDILSRLAQASGLAQCRAMVPDLLELVSECRLRLREGRVSAEDLAITFGLSKEPEEYVHDTVSTLAARQLARSGVALHAGETVRYVITDARSDVKDWRSAPLALLEEGLEYDVRKYLELLDRAASEVLEGILTRGGAAPLAGACGAEPAARRACARPDRAPYLPGFCGPAGR